MNVKQLLCGLLHVHIHGMSWLARQKYKRAVAKEFGGLRNVSVKMNRMYCCQWFKSLVCRSKKSVMVKYCAKCEHPFTGKDKKVYKPTETVKNDG